MDARNCYTFNGNFDPELLYVELYNDIPCKYEYAVDDDYELDVSKLDISLIEDLLDDSPHIRTYVADYLENESEPHKAETSTEFPWETEAKPNQRYMIINSHHRVIFIRKSDIVVYYHQRENVKDIAEWAQEIFNRFPKDEKESKAGKVSLIKVYQGDYYTSEKDVKQKVINIEENYNDDFLPIYNDAVEFLQDRSSGLVLFYGTMGSGNFYKNNLYN